MLIFTEFNLGGGNIYIYISDVLLLYNNARQHLRPSQILDRLCCRIHPTVLTMHQQITTYLVLCKKGCGDTITPLTKHYSTLKNPVAAEEGEKSLLGGNTCSCLKVEE